MTNAKDRFSRRAVTVVCHINEWREMQRLLQINPYSQRGRTMVVFNTHLYSQTTKPRNDFLDARENYGSDLNRDISLFKASIGHLKNRLARYESVPDPDGRPAPDSHAGEIIREIVWYQGKIDQELARMEGFSREIDLESAIVAPNRAASAKTAIKPTDASCDNRLAAIDAIFNQLGGGEWEIL